MFSSIFGNCTDSSDLSDGDESLVAPDPNVSTIDFEKFQEELLDRIVDSGFTTTEEQDITNFNRLSVLLETGQWYSGGSRFQELTELLQIRLGSNRTNLHSSCLRCLAAVEVPITFSKELRELILRHVFDQNFSENRVFATGILCNTIKDESFQHTEIVTRLFDRFMSLVEEYSKDEKELPSYEDEYNEDEENECENEDEEFFSYSSIYPVDQETPEDQQLIQLQTREAQREIRTKYPTESDQDESNLDDPIFLSLPRILTKPRTSEERIHEKRLDRFTRLTRGQMILMEIRYLVSYAGDLFEAHPQILMQGIFPTTTTTTTTEENLSQERIRIIKNILRVMRCKDCNTGVAGLDLLKSFLGIRSMFSTFLDLDGLQELGDVINSGGDFDFSVLVKSISVQELLFQVGPQKHLPEIYKLLKSFFLAYYIPDGASSFLIASMHSQLGLEYFEESILNGLIRAVVGFYDQPRFYPRLNSTLQILSRYLEVKIFTLIQGSLVSEAGEPHRVVLSHTIDDLFHPSKLKQLQVTLAKCKEWNEFLSSENMKKLIKSVVHSLKIFFQEFSIPHSIHAISFRILEICMISPALLDLMYTPLEPISEGKNPLDVLMVFCGSSDIPSSLGALRTLSMIVSDSTEEYQEAKKIVRKKFRNANGLLMVFAVLDHPTSTEILVECYVLLACLASDPDLAKILRTLEFPDHISRMLELSEQKLVLSSPVNCSEDPLEFLNTYFHSPLNASFRQEDKSHQNQHRHNCPHSGSGSSGVHSLAHSHHGHSHSHSHSHSHGRISFSTHGINATGHSNGPPGVPDVIKRYGQSYISSGKPSSPTLVLERFRFYAQKFLHAMESSFPRSDTRVSHSSSSLFLHRNEKSELSQKKSKKEPMELLRLVHHHLLQKGFSEAADQLLQDTHLEPLSEESLSQSSSLDGLLSDLQDQQLSTDNSERPFPSTTTTLQPYKPSTIRGVLSQGGLLSRRVGSEIGGYRHGISSLMHQQDRKWAWKHLERKTKFADDQLSHCHWLMDDSKNQYRIFSTKDGRLVCYSNHYHPNVDDRKSTFEWTTGDPHPSSRTLFDLEVSRDFRWITAATRTQTHLWDSHIDELFPRSEPQSKNSLPSPLRTFEGRSPDISFDCNQLLTTRSPNPMQIEGVLYSLVTGQRIHSFEQMNPLCTHLRTNARTVRFHPDGQLLVVEHALFDIRDPNPIHVFDRLTMKGPSSFHPNGALMIFGSLVWDFRSFSLVRKCNYFDDASLSFSPNGDVICAWSRSDEKAVGCSIVDGNDFSLIHYHHPGHCQRVNSMMISPLSDQILTVELNTLDAHTSANTIHVGSIGPLKELGVDSGNRGAGNGTGVGNGAFGGLPPSNAGWYDDDDSDDDMDHFMSSSDELFDAVGWRFIDSDSDDYSSSSW